MRYFDNSPFKTNKIKDLFINSDTRNTNNSDEYLSVVRDVGVIKYSERGDSGNKTSDSPEKYKMVDVGDLVINPMNVTIGSVGVSEYSGCLSGVYLVLKPKTSVNSKYYHYLFHDKGFQKYLKTISYGIMEIRESLNKTELFQFKIPKPQVDEQKEIVSYLDKKTNQIDKIIKKIEKKIELLKEQRISLINEVVTKGLNPNVEMKDSDFDWIGEIPSHWFCVGTNKIFNDLGSGTTPKSDNLEYYSDSGYHWITTTDLNEGIMYNTLSKITDKSLEDNPNLRLYPSGSIYISMYGGKIGKLGVSTFDSYCNQSVCVLPRNEKIVVKFYYYWFLGYQEFVKGMGRGGGQPNINKEMIKSFPTVKIPVNEQQQIVEYLDQQTKKIDKTILNEEKRMKLLKEYKQSLISEVVTGKKRVE